MQSIAYIPGSNGAGNASQMTVQNVRSPGASDILVNTVTGVPTKFYGSMGEPHTFTDPVTGETITIISEATAVDFAGHIDTGKIVIDAIAPGYVDTRGSLVGDIVVVRPITEWANNLFNVLSQSHEDDGKLKNSSITYNPNVYDHIASGAVIAGLGYGANLNASLSAGVCYINGNRQTIAAVASRTYTASKDTYVDLLYSATGTATVVYTEVANNAASPALAANSIRLGIVVSGANIASVASINQGQMDKILPISGGIAYAVTDSLGNLICCRDSTQKVLGFRRAAANSPALASGSQSLIPGLTVPFIVDGLTRIRTRFHQESIQSQAAGGSGQSTLIVEGAASIATGNYVNNGVNFTQQCIVDGVVTPTAGTHTYSAAMIPGGGTAIVRAVSYISVERY